VKGCVFALETKPLIHKVDCVRLSVSDLDAGLVFYCDELGHELIWRTEEQAGLRLPDDDTEIVLHTEPKAPEIDLKVRSADAAAVRFEQAGGRVVVPPFDIQIGRCVVVQDPWGNELVLLDTSKGLLVTDDEGYVVGNLESGAGGDGDD
jgi:lactoylglutathione lyase